MYKVTTSYLPNESHGGKVYLRADKGDILIDGKIIDELWFEAKSTVTEKCGRIPRDHVVSFCSSKDEALGVSEGEEEEGNDCLDERQAARVCGSRENLTTDVHMTTSDDHVATDDGVVTNDGVVTVTPLSRPPRGVEEEEDVKLSEEGVKVCDEGYNSGSYYSGETNENIEPLLPTTPVVSKQDEAGYEVPQITIDETLNTTITSIDTKTNKKRKLKGLFRQKTLESTRSGGKGDDLSEKYYNPPSDIRDNYFLRKTYFPIVRVLLSLVVALAVSFTCLFLLLLSFHPLLSFAIAFVLFMVMFVIPLSLLHQGFLCVVALLFPCLCSTRTKIAALLLLCVLIVNGPIIGIANKLHLATSCSCSVGMMMDATRTPTGSHMFPSVSTTNPQSDTLNVRRDVASRSPVQKECTKLFGRVDKKCGSMYREFRRYCKHSDSPRTSFDEILCAKDHDEFCMSNVTFADSCCVHRSDSSGYVVAERVRNVLFYILPVLLLLLLSDAYAYNKVYLTTKDADNIYITQRLKELDCERKNRGLTDLILPLTRIEFQTYLLRGRTALSRAEKSNVLTWFGILLLFGIISMCFVLLEDHLHAALLSALSPSCRQIYDVTTDVRYRLFIYVVLGTVLLIVLVQSYVLRMRSIICDYFYRDMVDIRSKHLYYKILHDRHSFGRHVRRKIQLLSESKRLSRRMSCTNMMYHVLPNPLKWLCRKLTVSTCMICDSTTCWKTVACREGNCLAHYCYECYVDAGQVCLTCKIPSSPPPNPNMKPQPVAV